MSRLLTEMAPLYDIYIFTASIDGYANPIVDRIDTQKVIKQRFYRESCLHPYVKNLRLIRKDLSQVILVDDNAFSYEGHFNDNAILIKTWNKESNDTEIDKLINLLTRLHDVEDVRLEDKTLR